MAASSLARLRVTVMLGWVGRDRYGSPQASRWMLGTSAAWTEGWSGMMS